MDLQKTVYTLNVTFGFADKDTRVINVPNPKRDHEFLSSEVSALDTWLVANQVIVGDKNGASSTGINSAYVEEKTTTEFDLR